MAVTRISGLASGLDIDATVKKLMTAEKIPLDKLNQQRQLVSWKQEGYRDVSSQLVTFLNDKLANLSLSASINAQKTSITGDTSSVSATANGAAGGSTMNVKVSQLATATTVISSGSLDASGAKDGKGGKDGSLLKMSDVTGGDGSVSISIGSGTAINIDYKATDSVNDFVQKINMSKAGVTAIYDSGSGTMSITSNSTGSSAVTLKGMAFEKFKIASEVTDANDTSTAVGTAATGKDAKVNINGLDMTQSSNQFTINGVQLTLNSVSPSGQSSQITVTSDNDKLVSSVQSFVDAYNSVLSLMNGKVGEERYNKYQPLTDEQKKDMSSDEIKLWESKAKSGMLKNDSILEQTISNMRTAMVQGVTLPDGKKISFAQLGISTGTYETKGKLFLDTDKLKSALDTNPNIVNDFFGTNNAASTQNNKFTENDGIIAKMKKVTRSALENMASTAGTSKVSSDTNAAFLVNSLLGTQLTSLDRQITDMTSRINDKETNYYKKFTAMESAMNRYNNQASSLASFR